MRFFGRLASLALSLALVGAGSVIAPAAATTTPAPTASPATATATATSTAESEQPAPTSGSEEPAPAFEPTINAVAPDGTEVEEPAPFNPIPLERLESDAKLSGSTTQDSDQVTATAERSGNIAVTLVTVKLYDNTLSETKAIDLTAAKASISHSSNYWSRMSAGRLTTSVVKTILAHPSKAKSTDGFFNIMSKVGTELNWVPGPNKALVLFVPDASLYYGGINGYLGGGWTEGPTSGRIILPKPSQFTNPVVGHEYGHVLGLMHANSLQCTNGRADVAYNSSTGLWADSACTSREYGDTVDLMGAAQYVSPAINSYLYDMGGFGTGLDIRNAGEAAGSRDYILGPWAGTANYRAVKVTDPVSKDVYYIELRTAVSYDSSKAINGNRGIKIVKADKVSGGAASVVLMPSTKPFDGWYATNHAWQAGQTFTAHTGMKIRMNSVYDTSASVTVTAPPPPAPAAPLAACPTVESRKAPVRDLTTASIKSPADVVAADSTGVLWNYPASGNGTLKPRIRLGSGWKDLKEGFVADWNQDGVYDLVTMWRTSGKLTVYMGRFGGGFNAPLTLMERGWSSMTSTVGQFCSNNNYPGIVTRDLSGNLKFFRNANGWATLATATALGPGWSSMSHLTMVDWDADGRQDIVAKSLYGKPVVRRTDGAGRLMAEATKVLPGDWSDVTNVRAAHGFSGVDSKGLLLRMTAGSHHYLPILGTGTWGTSKSFGIGWKFYNIFK